jgi:hypothetical protein
MDHIQSMHVTSLRSKQFGSIQELLAATSALGRWSLGKHAQRLPDYQQQRQTGSDRKAAARSNSGSGHLGCDVLLVNL